MKPADKSSISNRTPSWINVTSLLRGSLHAFLTLLLLCACHPPKANPKKWAVEKVFNLESFQTTLRLNKTTLTAGETLEMEIDLLAPLGSNLTIPAPALKNLDLIERVALPVQLQNTGTEFHSFRALFQAGPPSSIQNQTLAIEISTLDPKIRSKKLSLALPDITIRSIFTDGKSSGSLPPLEDYVAP